MIWLKHDLHGVKNCYLENEAIADEKNGWVRFEPKSDLDNQDKKNNQDYVDELSNEDLHISMVKEPISNSFQNIKKRGRPFGNK